MKTAANSNIWYACFLTLLRFDLLVPLLVIIISVSLSYIDLCWVSNQSWKCKLCRWLANWCNKINFIRFYAVLKPLNLKEHRGKIMIATAWILSAFCSAPQVMLDKVTVDNIVWRRAIESIFVCKQSLTNFFVSSFSSRWYFTLRLIQTSQTSLNVCRSTCCRLQER